MILTLRFEQKREIRDRTGSHVTYNHSCYIWWVTLYTNEVYRIEMKDATYGWLMDNATAPCHRPDIWTTWLRHVTGQAYVRSDCVMSQVRHMKNWTNTSIYDSLVSRISERWILTHGRLDSESCHRWDIWDTSENNERLHCVHSESYTEA